MLIIIVAGKIKFICCYMKLVTLILRKITLAKMHSWKIGTHCVTFVPKVNYCMNTGGDVIFHVNKYLEGKTQHS